MVTLKFPNLSKRQLKNIVSAAEEMGLESKITAGTSKFELAVYCPDYEESKKVKQKLCACLLPVPTDKNLASICLNTEFEVYKILNQVLEMFFGIIAEAAGIQEIPAPLWVIQKNIFRDHIELKLTMSEDKLLVIISLMEKYLLKLRDKTEKGLESYQDYYKKARPLPLSFSSAVGLNIAGKEAQQEFIDLLKTALKKRADQPAQDILNLLGKELLVFTAPMTITIEDPEDLQAILQHMMEKLAKNGRYIDQALKLLTEAEIVIELS